MKLKNAFHLVFSVSAVGILFLLSSPAVYAALSYGSGTYTNICGTGTMATADTCAQGCNTATGTCTGSNTSVVKYTCDGTTTECRDNESGFSSSQSFAGAACNKTVQIDVFDKNCRDGSGNWTCGAGNLKDYMVWYSGACQTNTPTPTPSATPNPTPTITPTPTCIPRPACLDVLPPERRCLMQESLRFCPATPTPTPSNTSSCDNLSVTNGDNSYVPATVRLRARGSDTGGSIQRYRFYFGDSQQVESTNVEVQHQYTNSGTFTARVDVLDSRGVWKTSDNCDTTVTVKPVAIESQKSDCSDLFIRDGNYTQPPTTGKFELTGYDNKGGIKRYKVDYGNGIVKESDSGTFEQRYDTAGTYIVRGYIQDSQGNWKGGSGNCERNFYVNTKPLTYQPKTGTPTLFTITALLAGFSGLGLFMVKKKMM